MGFSSVPYMCPGGSLRTSSASVAIGGAKTKCGFTAPRVTIYPPPFCLCPLPPPGAFLQNRLPRPEAHVVRRRVPQDFMIPEAVAVINRIPGLFSLVFCPSPAHPACTAQAPSPVSLCRVWHRRPRLCLFVVCAAGTRFHRTAQPTSVCSFIVLCLSHLRPRVVQHPRSLYKAQRLPGPRATGPGGSRVEPWPVCHFAHLFVPFRALLVYHLCPPFFAPFRNSLPHLILQQFYNYPVLWHGICYVSVRWALPILVKGERPFVLLKTLPRLYCSLT
jgi:hypothetical protein